jgi:rare lipoprotein A
MDSMRRSLALILPALMLLCLGGPGAAKDTKSDTEAGTRPAALPTPKGPAKVDRSGKQRSGKASYYGSAFAGKKMANGKPMDPRSSGAASKTLPLGTRAKVTNTETGKSAEVVIKDRGPYVPGRIIDVTPATAEKLDMKEDGVAPVVVKPIEVPPKAKRDGTPK